MQALRYEKDTALISGWRTHGIWVTLSVLVTLITLVFLAHWISIVRILYLFRNSDAGLMILGFTLFAIANWVKAVRLRRLTVEVSVSLVQMFRIVCLYNMMSSLMPAGLGEASYPALVKMRYRIPLSAGTSAVLISRLFDLVSVASCCAAVLWASGLANSHLAWLALAGSLAFLIGLGTIFLASASEAARDYLRWLEEVAEPVGALITFLQRMQGVIARIASAKEIVLVTLLTIAIWLSAYGVSWIASRSIHLPLGFRANFLGASLSILLSVLPVKGVAGLGTAHAGWVMGLVLLGWPPQTALDLAVSMHLIITAYTVLLGLLGLSVFVPSVTPFWKKGLR